MLLKIEKEFPKIYFIKQVIVSFVLLNNKKKWGTSSLSLAYYIVKTTTRKSAILKKFGNWSKYRNKLFIIEWGFRPIYLIKSEYNTSNI